MGALLLPEPTYSGPDKVIYFQGAQGLEDELNRDKKCSWFVTFYTAWNPACVTFAPVFAQMSVECALDNLKFGKVDVGRYPEAAKKYQINDGSLSNQLPTLILFREGKEVLRRPMFDAKGKVLKFSFSQENIKRAFDLNNLHEECKSSMKNKKTVQNTRHIKSE